MVKGILRFAETGVLASAILGIYGFTFLTVFSLNPKVENVAANNSTPQTSVLGTNTINNNSLTLENISDDTYDFRTSLEKSGDNKYIYTISFLNGGEVVNKNLISLSNVGTKNAVVSYSLDSKIESLEGATFVQNRKVVDFSNVEKLYTFDLANDEVEQLGINLQRNGSSDTWVTIKLIISY
jgi:hypothetical protein